MKDQSVFEKGMKRIFVDIVFHLKVMALRRTTKKPKDVLYIVPELLQGCIMQQPANRCIEEVVSITL